MEKKAQQEEGIRPLEVLEKEVHSFTHETFPGQFWADKRDAKMSWPSPLSLKSSPRGKDPHVIVTYIRSAENIEEGAYFCSIAECVVSNWALRLAGAARIEKSRIAFWVEGASCANAQRRESPGAVAEAAYSKAAQSRWRMGVLGTLGPPHLPFRGPLPFPTLLLYPTLPSSRSSGSILLKCLLEQKFKMYSSLKAGGWIQGN